MEVLHAHCCGIDVHAKFLVACCRHIGPTGHVTKSLRTFGTMTGDLQALVDWLTSEAITHVAIDADWLAQLLQYGLLRSVLSRPW